MNWKKIGRIFNPNNFDWMLSHAQMPIVFHLNDDLYRIYFSTRDSEQRSHGAYIEIDINNPNEILSYSKTPIIAPGGIGHFDSCGASPSSIFQIGDDIYLYYIGWNKGHEGPLFYSSIGLAISKDGGKTFVKFSNAPILNRSEYDPCLLTSPVVYKTDSEDLNMLYVSGTKWEKTENSELVSYYHIKHASSKDGINWTRKGKVAIDFETEDETNIARAHVIKTNNGYESHFCYKVGEHPYQLGFATSSDGLNWDRQPFPSVPRCEFDDQMQAYPNAVIHNNKKYLFYNGNRFGKDGILLAVSD